MSNSSASATNVYDNLCRYQLMAGSFLTQSILEQLCQQWGQNAIGQVLYDLHATFQSDPILAGRYGLRNIQVLIEQLER